jgi:hypothetical protein
VSFLVDTNILSEMSENIRDDPIAQRTPRIEVPTAFPVDGNHATFHFCNLCITDQTSWSECS